jgi:D-alanyl-D-alanine carboxypeptidase/D-alanyl-D-alanine-endopeptidase (penicillin-binding protein 4)
LPIGRFCLWRAAWAGLVLAAAAAWSAASAAATPGSTEPAPATAALPATVAQALRQARVPADALAVVVQEAGSGRVRLQHRADAAHNPASLTKLLTTYAALDLLGPAWTWRTGVWLAGPLRAGVLDGDLVVRGSGDPTLTLERTWLLLERVRQLGVREIRGDFVIDRSAFAAAQGAAGEFDSQPLRPHNVQPDALLLNFRAVTYRFVPDAARGVARVAAEPALAGVGVDAEVALAHGPCGDWRSALQARFDDPQRVRFAGTFPQACGERAWPVAHPQPAAYDARLLRALWQGAGGVLGGTVREGAAPNSAPSFEFESPPLAAVVRDINKFSNNVMAQQLFLTLAAQALPPGIPATEAAARERLAQWAAARLGDVAAGLRVDNGSGLSRHNRISAQALARLLQQAWAGPLMAELMASLPIAALDGTLRRTQAGAGRAHLKTGSLRDVVAVAGYVLADSGQRYVLVAIVEHPQAGAARPALEALLDWTLADGAPAGQAGRADRAPAPPSR